MFIIAFLADAKLVFLHFVFTEKKAAFLFAVYFSILLKKPSKRFSLGLFLAVWPLVLRSKSIVVVWSKTDSSLDYEDDNDEIKRACVKSACGLITLTTFKNEPNWGKEAREKVNQRF
jgi:hypothetical protein